MPKLSLDLLGIADLPLDSHSDAEILAAIESEITTLKQVQKVLARAAEQMAGSEEDRSPQPLRDYQ